jgi:phosphate-selective porin
VLTILSTIGLLASGQPASAQQPAAAPPPPPVAPALAPAAAPPMGAPIAPPLAPPVVSPTAPPPAPAPPLSQPAAMPAPAPAAASATDLTTEPLAGFSDGVAFLRSPDNEFVFFPGGRLQIDGYFFKSDNATPRNTFLIRRARLELAGWIGTFTFFSIGADFAVPTPSATTSPALQANLNATDDYIAIAPWGDLAILQFGQFDAPFTLENRTSDKYFDFMERSVTVRAFGVPTNKEQGFMLHGTTPERHYYYSLAVINGDGQNFRNVDNNFDLLGRAWIAPLSFGAPELLNRITVGGSFWTGDRTNAEALPGQTTQAGFDILKPSWTWTSGTTTTPVELHQFGRMNAFALELNAPLGHRAGVRWEYVWKHQPLAVANVAAPKLPVALGTDDLKGWSTYGEAWYWLMGDDTIIGEAGMQQPSRFKKFGVKPPRDGVMIAARLDYLNETISEGTEAAALMLGSPVTGDTKLTALTLGVNYWHSKRFRATFNYVLNHFDGTTPYVKNLKSDTEQEFLFRLGIAL